MMKQFIPTAPYAAQMPRSTVCLALCFLFVYPALEAAPRSLSLDESVKLAVAQNIDLQKSGIDLATAEFAAKNTWSSIFSVVNPSATLSYSTPLFSGEGFQLSSAQGTYNIRTSVSLLFNTGLPQTMRLTALERQSKQLTYEKAIKDVELNVTTSFYTLIAGQDNLSNLENALASVERQLEKDNISFEYGMISRLDQLTSQLNVETARLNLNNARVTYMTDMQNFLALLGLDYAPDITLAGSLKATRVDLNADTLIARYLPQNLDIVEKQYSIEKSELTAKKAALEPWLTASLGWNMGISDTRTTLEQKSSFDTMKFTDSLSASVTLTIPIDLCISGTTTNQSLRISKAEIEKARLDLRSVENTARNEIRSYADKLRNSWSSIEIARLQVEIAEQTYALSDEGFQMGMGESLSLEGNRNKRADARYDLLQAELTYYSLTLDLASALNITTQELLEMKP
jgi:outer membrane protein TolC